MNKVSNEEARHAWLKSELLGLPAGSTILDVGAGECQYKKYCRHLDYTSQDIAEYDGIGNSRGLQTGDWDFQQIDIVCDLLEIPENRTYDAVLCTEVLEHVPDPAAAIRKLMRLTSPNGMLIITAPFCSLTHFAPFHYATGFSEYFYRWHLESAGFNIEILQPNGGYFDFMAQELGRANRMHRDYIHRRLGFFGMTIFGLAKYFMHHKAGSDGTRDQRRSAELLTFGWHVKARRPS